METGKKPRLATPDAFDIWIEAGRGEPNYWRDIWHYRELFLILAWRDVAVRYKQTIAGMTWAVVQPLLSVGVMTLIFGKIAGLPADGNAPYAVMVLAGILPWQLFAHALSSASQSIVANAGLISKVYFPRLIIPASSIVVSLVDFLVATAMLVVLMAWYEFWPSWRIVTLPLFVVLAIFAALGPALIATALAVRYRDVRILIPFVLQIGLYLSPVAYSSSVVREKVGEEWFLVYALNPMVGVIDGFRWALMQSAVAFDWLSFGISMSVMVFLCILGLAYFRRTERQFADLI